MKHKCDGNLDKMSNLSIFQNSEVSNFKFRCVVHGFMPKNTHDIISMHG